MFSPGLVNNLDNLAREGIIDFDATAFVTGTKPRYVGNPSYSQLSLPDMSAVDTSNLKQPVKDEMVYTKESGNVSKNPLWKKILFGAVTGGLLIFGGYKLYKAKPLKNLFSQKIPNLITKIGGSVKNACKSAGSFIKNTAVNIWNKICGLFGKKNP